MTVSKGFTPEKAILCIREPDGMLVMATTTAINHSVMSGNGSLRPYHGSPHATQEERLRYLHGFAPEAAGSVKEALETGNFDLETASRADLIEYAADEYGADLSQHKTRVKVYEELMALKNAAGRAQPVTPGGLSAAG